MSEFTVSTRLSDSAGIQLYADDEKTDPAGNWLQSGEFRKNWYQPDKLNSRAIAIND